jgi:hypothetical protein
MRKTILVLTATAFVGVTTLAPTPASAVFFLLPFVLMAKKDPNFKAVNPYAKPVAKRHHHHHHAKKMAKTS